MGLWWKEVKVLCFTIIPHTSTPVPKLFLTKNANLLQPKNILTAFRPHYNRRTSLPTPTVLAHMHYTIIIDMLDIAINLEMWSENARKESDLAQRYCLK